MSSTDRISGSLIDRQLSDSSADKGNVSGASIKMGKKYKGKTCVYCGNALATSMDHVFAREFFLRGDRQNLPQVPACDGCNNGKSQLEHYLTAVLPFGGRHSTAKANLEPVPNRLSKNLKVRKRLYVGWGKSWSKESGVYVLSSTQPVDNKQLERLISFIVRGLAWFHWQTLMPPNHYLKVMALTESGDRAFEKLMSHPDLHTGVECDLGRGTVVYKGKQGLDQPEITLWRFLMYGGLKFSDEEDSGESASVICAMTGPAVMMK